ncbi:ROK family protein [Marinilabiliaceae bacterium ANBcel2]|nr:ROK family protein [Marinilabiliaceae bacterium ANBcel2]
MTPQSIFRDSESVSNQSRQSQQKQKIVKALSKSDKALTIPDFQKKIKISTPTIIKLINELIEEKLVIEEGKKETDNGRRPTLYSLNIDRFYAIGVEILLKRVSISLVRLDQKVVYKKKNSQFILENSSECLTEVLSFINDFLKEVDISYDYILGVGIGLTGRVNSITGESFNYFDFTPKPIASYIAEKIKLPVFINNDTHITGLAEQVFGQARDVNNALILNVSRGLGMTIIVNKKILTGGMGFAGEFGHMQMGYSNKLCMCGKRGCLGMEVSGFALEEKFKEEIKKGEISLAVSPNTDLENIRYDDILQAAEKGDGLSISLLQKIGEMLGMALGNIVNLLNPELVIIGGKFAQTDYLFNDSIKTGMHKTALTAPLKFLEVKASELDKEIGCRAAATLAFREFDLL